MRQIKTYQSTNKCHYFLLKEVYYFLLQRMHLLTQLNFQFQLKICKTSKMYLKLCNCQFVQSLLIVTNICSQV